MLANRSRSIHNASIKHKMDACMSQDNENPKGRAKGGVARTNRLSKDRRVAIARKAATTRWGHKAIHKGNFKKEFGIDAECYVLDDEYKTAVITQLGMGEILGLGSGGSRLPRFMFNKTMSEYIWPELRDKIENPIAFHIVSAGQSGKIRANGYDAAVLVDICRAILNASAEKKRINPAVVVQASIILGASAKSGIQGLVYALAGYDRTKEDVIEAYKMYVKEEAREYEREFTPELYEEWYRLYGLQKPIRGRPWEFKYLTIDHIYKPLARSSGKVFDLAKSNKAVNGTASDKIHQFLSEIGVKALRTQIGKITGIATVSQSREEYERHIEEKILGQQSLKFG